jgi:hypothetical protein
VPALWSINRTCIINAVAGGIGIDIAIRNQGMIEPLAQATYS